MKRILLVAQSIGKWGETDGGVTFYKHLIKKLAKFKIPTDIITYGPKNEIEKKGNVTIFVYKPRIALKLDPQHYIDPTMSLINIEKITNNKKYCLVYSGTPDPLGRMALKVAKKNKCPFVTFYHTLLDDYAEVRIKKYVQDKLHNLKNKKILSEKSFEKISNHLGKNAKSIMGYWLNSFYKKSDIIFTPSKLVKKKLKKFFEGEIKILPHGVDSKIFNPKYRTRNNKKIEAIYVGRITPEKNLRLLVDTFSKRKEVDLKIIGEGPYLEEMKRLLPQAKYLGTVSGKKLSKEYANSDFLVFPSKTDTFGIVVLEAMSSGLPAIVMDSPGPKEIVHNGVTGYIAKNKKDFIKKVNFLVKNTKLIRSMGKEARKYAKKQTWDVGFNELLKYFEKLSKFNS